MVTFLWISGIFSFVLLIYLVIGFVLAARMKTLGEMDWEKYPVIEDNDIWLVIFFWLLMGIDKLWKEGFKIG